MLRRARLARVAISSALCVHTKPATEHAPGVDVAVGETPVDGDGVGAQPSESKVASTPAVLFVLFAHTVPGAAI